MYEVPVKIKNTSDSAKRVMIKPPKTGKFRIDFNRRKKNNLIAPGLYLEILVIFECDEAADQEDTIEIITEAGKTIVLPLSARVSQSYVIFEPFVSFSFIPVNTKAVEYVKFENIGDQNAVVNFILEKESVLKLDRVEMNIPQKTREYKKTLSKKERERHSTLQITFESAFN